MDLGKAFKRYGSVVESFVHKTRSKKNTDLISKPSFVLEDGVYILHETLGVKGVEGWNPKNNDGVIGILLIEDEHQLVVALEDAPENLTWSEKRGLINQPVDELEDLQNDFNGEIYCRRLNSPDFPAAYYCKTYNKGGRSWYLPSTGELWLICRHLEEIQNALETVGGQKLITTWDEGDPVYWSSTEDSAALALDLYFTNGSFYWDFKVSNRHKVRPVSKFDFSTLKESFTRKIRSKKNDELTSKADTAFVTDGVYILHETLGVRTVDSWNPKDNEGVVGILLVEDDHKIVVALEDAPERLHWSKKDKLVNEPIEETEDAESDFNGEYYCQKLDSPKFPAAYYCKTYNKGGRNWYLPSSGELWMIYHHLEEIQNALSIVGGQKLITNWDEGYPVYWSSTEVSDTYLWRLLLLDGDLGWTNKVYSRHKVRPVSKFDFSTLKESFTRKMSSKKNDELTTKADTAFVTDGVYILHETLGVNGVEEWNPEDNEGVVGILLIEDDHKIVVATEDAPERLHWSKKDKLVNEPIKKKKDAQNDFNGEYYCRKLNSPNYPVEYYCKTYNKGGRSWYLPSSGELWLIYNHLEEIQNALSIVGGQKLITNWNEGVPVYWSSTERGAEHAWYLNLRSGSLDCWGSKVGGIGKVRPVSNFNLSELKESFTKKISKKNSTEVIGKSERMFLEESIAQMVYSFGKNAMVPNNDKKLKFGYKLPFGCLPNFFNSNKILDNGDVIKRTKTRSFLGYTQTYEIIAVDIYFASLSKKVYVGMEKPSSLSQSESSPKIYNLYGAASSGILELSEFNIDELRQILQNLQERTKMKKPLRKKIVLKSEENY